MVGKQTRRIRLAVVLCSLVLSAACGKNRTPTSPSAASTSTPSATQVGINAQGIAIDGAYTMNVGERLQVSAMVTMSDGAREDRTSTATWSSDNGAVVSVASGLITAVSAGQSVVTARYESVLARLTVTVRGGNGGGEGGSGGGGTGGGGGGGNGPTVERLQIEGVSSVAVGGSGAVAAVAFFTDGSRETVTNQTVWSVAPSDVAVVSSGQLHGLRPGAATVTGSFQGLSGSFNTTVSATALSVTSVAVSGTQTVGVGNTSQLVATATLSDGSQMSATTLAQWESGNPGVATVADGLVRGVAAGSAVITARVAGVAGQATMTVTTGGGGTPTVTGLTISGDGSVVAGQTLQLTATASFSNGTQQNVNATASWNSSSPGTAGVAGGLVSGNAAGSTTITATYQGQTASKQVTVTGSGGGTPTVTGLTLSGDASVVVGQSVQLTATAQLSNGTQQNVTASASWSSSGSSASVAGGLVTGNAAGSVTITATYQGQSATRQVTVSATPISVVSISVTGNLSVGVGLSSQLTVRATMSNGTIIDVTGQAAYQSSNSLFVSVNASGQITGLLAGLANITATYQGVSASVQVTITVTLPVVNSLTINGASSVRVLQLLNLSAVANMSDGSQQTVTNSCQWSSSNLGILEFLTNGVLRALVVGNVDVTVAYQGKTAQKTIAVTLF